MSSNASGSMMYFVEYSPPELPSSIKCSTTLALDKSSSIILPDNSSVNLDWSDS